MDSNFKEKELNDEDFILLLTLYIDTQRIRETESNIMALYIINTDQVKTTWDN